jgi:hypothetical protein
LVADSAPLARALDIAIRAETQVGAVSFAGVGLLDDAIREHLELKRLRGADPGEVAREEKDALGPGRGEGREAKDGDHAGPASDSGEHVFSDSESVPVANSSQASHLSQETVEINMDAELAAGNDSDHEQGTRDDVPAGPVGHPAHTQADPGDSLEWEMPSDRSAEPRGVVAAESYADTDPDADSGAVEQVDDVLEETPDFLRDTPEQERLWFEQRPPRDFDFNE